MSMAMMGCMGDVEIIAISEGNPQLVVAAEYDSSELFVFNSTVPSCTLLRVYFVSAI